MEHFKWKVTSISLLFMLLPRDHAEALESHPMVVHWCWGFLVSAPLSLSTSPVPKVISTNIYVKRMANLQGNTGKYRKGGSTRESQMKTLKVQ